MTTTIKYIHLSNKLINLIYDEKPNKLNNCMLKPKGLWFSKNNEWEEFCTSTGWTYLYKYELDVDFDNFLILDTIKKLDDFVKKYSNPKTTCIKWNKVLGDYSGIYFDNYLELKQYVYDTKQFDIQYTWFFAVDINSGCIFAKSNVKAFELVDK
jgi:hypothetical protein